MHACLATSCLLILDQKGVQSFILKILNALVAIIIIHTTINFFILNSCILIINALIYVYFEEKFNSSYNEGKLAIDRSANVERCGRACIAEL